jgi:hypothetical protein
VRRLSSFLLLLFLAFDIKAGVRVDRLFIRTDYINLLVKREEARFSDNFQIVAVQIENGKFSMDDGGHDFYDIGTKEINKGQFEISYSPFLNIHDKLKSQTITLVVLNRDSLKIVIKDKKSSAIIKEVFFVSKYKDFVFSQPIMKCINRLLLSDTYILLSDNSIIDSLKISISGIVSSSKLFEKTDFFNAYFQADKSYPREHYFILSLKGSRQTEEFVIPTDFYKRDIIPLFGFSFVKKPDWLDITRDKTPKYILKRN